MHGCVVFFSHARPTGALKLKYNHLDSGLSSVRRQSAFTYPSSEDGEDECCYHAVEETSRGAAVTNAFVRPWSRRITPGNTAVPQSPETVGGHHGLKPGRSCLVKQGYRGHQSWNNKSKVGKEPRAFAAITYASGETHSRFVHTQPSKQRTTSRSDLDVGDICDPSPKQNKRMRERKKKTSCRGSTIVACLAMAQCDRTCENRC